LNFKKSIVVFIFTALISLPVFSQIKFGIKTGATAILVPVYGITFGSVYIEPTHPWNFGTHAGVFLRINKEVIYFQPEMAFESNAFKYTVINNYVTKDVKQRINKLEIPLLFGAQFDITRFFLGPSASIKIGLPTALVNDPDFNKLFDKITWEYQVGFGIDLPEKIDLEVRFRGYLGKDSEGVEKIGYQTFTLDRCHFSFLFSIGYMF